MVSALDEALLETGVDHAAAAGAFGAAVDGQARVSFGTTVKEVMRSEQ